MNTHFKPPKFTWTAEAEETMRRLINAGHSASMIAHAIGATRNAVCGKAFRLGLHKPVQVTTSSAPKPERYIRRKFSWSPRVVARLRELSAEKLTSEAIALTLSREFVGVATASSVRAKASLLKIELRGREAQSHQWQIKGAAAQKRKKVERHAAIWERPAVAAPIGVSIIDLTPSACRFPLGDPLESDFSFCGSQKAPASPYCVGHHLLCYSRGK